jgi:ABC-2 type transport system ATP-binding protein
MSPVLEYSNVSRSFRRFLTRVPVLNDVSFSVGEGEVLGLLGRNGAGKTTLINIAIGLLYPGSGTVRVFGQSPTEHPVTVKERIGYVQEEGLLRGGQTIRELIAFYRGIFRKWDDSMEREILDRFSLSPKARLSRLSKGQRRQIALLCAICHRPELLLLDEPASGLDPATRREFLEAAILLLNREGTTILFSSHQLNDVERLGGRVVLLDEGKVKLDRDLDRVREEVFVAIVPRASVPNDDRLKQIPGCLRVRAVQQDWHVVVEGPEADVHKRLVDSVGHNGIRCVRMPLEELFIELVGTSRAKEIA